MSLHPFHLLYALADSFPVHSAGAVRLSFIKLKYKLFKPVYNQNEIAYNSNVEEKASA